MQSSGGQEYGWIEQMGIPPHQSPEGLLDRLAAHDERSIESALGIRLVGVDLAAMDAKTCALVRIGAILATGAGAPTYEWAVRAAFNAGATVEEILGVVTAVAPAIGVARVVSAAPALALAIGYDVDAAFERPYD
jgi:4-carboxymuconolactone decarboxylase